MYVTPCIKDGGKNRALNTRVSMLGLSLSYSVPQILSQFIIFNPEESVDCTVPGWVQKPNTFTSTHASSFAKGSVSLFH